MTPRTTPAFRSPNAITVLDDGTVLRRVTVKLTMCGHNALFFGQVGDWTWETVSMMCHTNVFAARNAAGNPTYLAFYYFHTCGTPSTHPYGFTIGDELEVATRVFDFGSESVLTLHRVGFFRGQRPRSLDPVEFYEHPRDDCLYIENFNRWLTRSTQDRNRDLTSSSPIGFRHAHLPRLPAGYSPRAVFGPARVNGTFHATNHDDYEAIARDYETAYEIDVNRDINGVGLVYFAAFFSIVDTAILRLWRELGRSDRQFISRRIVDHKLSYLGNAEIDSTLSIRVGLRARRDRPGDELVDVLVRDQATARPLAIAGIHQLVGRQ